MSRYTSEEELEIYDTTINLHASVGLFIAAFSKVELALTVLLATLCKQTDFGTFHIITRGLDARAKLGRIRELCDKKALIVPRSDLDKRLVLFENKVSPFRNKLAHQFLTMPTNKPILALADISFLTLEPTQPDLVVSEEALDFYTDWLNDFFEDLAQTVAHARNETTLTISRPRSMEPQAFHHKIDALDRAAKLEILPKKAPQRE